jgi:hypothetical protein
VVVQLPLVEQIRGVQQAYSDLQIESVDYVWEDAGSTLGQVLHLSLSSADRTEPKAGE